MVQRVSGLASGMDVDSIVTKMVQAQRVPLDKLVQKKQTLLWQRESYRDFNTKILDFRNNKLSTYRLEGTFNSKKVSIGGDTGAISAKVNGAVTGSNMTVKVESLGTAATNASTDSLDLTGTSVITGPQTFYVNGKKIVTDENETLNSILAKITNQTNVSAYYDENVKKVSFIAKNTGKMTIKDMNSQEDLPDKMDTIQLSGDFLTNTLKMGAGTAGKQASVYVNGIKYEPNSNVFTANGVEITLLRESQGAGSNLSISTDSDAMVDKIKSFVTDYNAMLKSLTDTIDETRYRDYAPLTEEQKKSMTDTQIEQWEKKAKSGLLRNDDILSKAVQNMRYSIMSNVDAGTGSKYKNLASIGITTGSYLENGKLYLDETKLRAAIEADPNAVKNIFTSKGDLTDSTKNVGVAEQMYRSFNDIQKSIMNKIGYTSLDDSTSRDESIIGKQIYNLTKQIQSGEDRIKDLEDRYYKQFSAMETAINSYNSQSAYLSNAFK
ncbi:flagellar filament capping protein FliD [Gorillibacterium sp. sgz500922]|uniref:flagellar filament capping protein FliD n=1 Tax=Gorillibacterium sp. sgz500922 TaxID=3446694 RepID=UPI003F66EBFE